jgi:hypothetical protein
MLYARLLLTAICTSQVSQEVLVQGDGQFIEVVKKIQAKAKLVRIGSLPFTELGRLKAYILNSESRG